MINEEWIKKKTHTHTIKNAPFVTLYDMHAVTFVLPVEMVLGLCWFILIPRLNHMRSNRPSDSCSKFYLHQKKKRCVCVS